MINDSATRGNQLHAKSAKDFHPFKPTPLLEGTAVGRKKRGCAIWKLSNGLPKCATDITCSTYLDEKGYHERGMSFLIAYKQQVGAVPVQVEAIEDSSWKFVKYTKKLSRNIFSIEGQK